MNIAVFTTIALTHEHILTIMSIPGMDADVQESYAPGWCGQKTGMYMFRGNMTHEASLAIEALNFVTGVCAA
jgi:hypothetical protein